MTYNISNNQKRPLRAIRNNRRPPENRRDYWKIEDITALHQRPQATSIDQQIQLETTGEHWRPVETNEDHGRLPGTTTNLQTPLTQAEAAGNQHKQSKTNRDYWRSANTTRDYQIPLVIYR